jgi:hypothetical protein
MNLKHRDTPESAAHWDYAERVSREVEAEIVRERERKAAPVTTERADQLLKAMDGHPDDMAVLFINGWGAPEITCGEMRRLLSNSNTSMTKRGNP